MNKIYAIGICFMLSGCLMGPNYHPPETVLCDAWSSEEKIVSTAPAPIAWWQIFNDPLLERYIEMAALHNNQILVAEANICQARAIRQVTASELFPHVSADLNATRTYFSKNGPLFAILPGGVEGASAATTGLPFQLQVPQTQNLYNALIDASWEIDLFGKRRRAVEAADATIGGTIEQRNDVLISVLAEVAINYIELRSNQKRGILLEENISLLENIAWLVRHQVHAGYRNSLDIKRVEADLNDARAALPNVVAQIYQNIYAISILTGNLPEALLSELLPIQPLPMLPCQITVGIRSDLLRRRPDIRKAERDLAAATANIGVAVASFFPTFTLIGDIGFQSLQLSNLFQAKSLTWAVGGDILIPIFHGGKLVGNLRASKAQAIAATYFYQQTVLAALEEAESGIVLYSEELKTLENLKDSVLKREEIVFINTERYSKGLTNVKDVLDTERDLNFSKQNLLTSETSALIDLVILYKALGGGWQPMNECLALNLLYEE